MDVGLGRVGPSYWMFCAWASIQKRSHAPLCYSDEVTNTEILKDLFRSWEPSEIGTARCLTSSKTHMLCHE